LLPLVSVFRCKSSSFTVRMHFGGWLCLYPLGSSCCSVYSVVGWGRWQPLPIPVLRSHHLLSVNCGVTVIFIMLAHIWLKQSTEAIDMAQNWPLWRLLAALLVVLQADDDEDDLIECYYSLFYDWLLYRWLIDLCMQAACGCEWWRVCVYSAVNCANYVQENILSIICVIQSEKKLS